MADMVVTILGCGTSRGVPEIPENWQLCDPSEQKNRRQRASIHLQVADQSIIIDTTPDLRNQVLSANIKHVNAVLYTHDHADHTHGIDDLRGFSYAQKTQIPIYMNRETADIIVPRFHYAFEGKGGYPAICQSKLITAGVTFPIGGVEIIPFNQQHGRINSLGFRIGDFAYSTDLNALDDAAFDILDGVKTWVVDALRYDPHPTHSHLDQTLDWIDRVKPAQAILTHMTGMLDYQTLCRELPTHIRPAYDGMQIKL